MGRTQLSDVNAGRAIHCGIDPRTAKPAMKVAEPVEAANRRWQKAAMKQYKNNIGRRP
jgi:hypothetical protein